MRNNKKQRQQLYSVVAILIFGTAIAVTSIRAHEATTLAAICAGEQATLRQETFGTLDPRLGAKASFVYDFTSGTALDSNKADIALPLASAPWHP